VHQEIYSRVTTPYDADAIDQLLHKHGLTHKHPLLTDNLRRGFLMGEFPTLKKTTIFPNHPSCADHEDFIRSYLSEEVEAGRMSGPFTQEETESILMGPFQCSPIIISVQPQNAGEPDKLCLCRHLSKGNKHQPATNTYIDKEKFPTKYNTAAEVAEIVSPPFSSISLPLPSFRHHRRRRRYDETRPGIASRAPVPDEIKRPGVATRALPRLDDAEAGSRDSCAPASRRRKGQEPRSCAPRASTTQRSGVAPRALLHLDDVMARSCARALLAPRRRKGQESRLVRSCTSTM
jgi:hypothetical protein